MGQLTSLGANQNLAFLPLRYAIQFSATGVSDGRAHSWFRQVVPVGSVGLVGSVGSSLLPKLPGHFSNMRRITVCGVLLHDWRLLGHCHCHADCSRSANTEHSHNICCKSEWSVIKTTFFFLSSLINTHTDSMHSSFYLLPVSMGNIWFFTAQDGSILFWSRAWETTSVMKGSFSSAWWCLGQQFIFRWRA